jgi:hypothetical protein
MKYRTAVYMIIKDEIYIIELIKYYLKIGFDYFIILDDESSIDYELIFIENGINKNMYFLYKTTNIIIENFGGFFLHEAKSSFFVKNYLYNILINNNIDYVLQIDADEFLFIKDENNNINDINNIINKYSPFDSLRINWLIFGSNSLYSKKSESVIKNFNRCNDKLEHYCKSLTKVSSIDLHYLSVCGGISAHFLPITGNSITKNLSNEIVDNNNVQINIDENKEINVYLAHYVNQDFITFIKRKIIRLSHCKDEIKDIEYVKKYLYDNLSDFTEFMLLKYFNKEVNSEYNEKFKIIPDSFISFLISFFKRHDTNNKINNDIIHKLYGIN